MFVSGEPGWGCCIGDTRRLGALASRHIMFCMVVDASALYPPAAWQAGLKGVVVFGSMSD